MTSSDREGGGRLVPITFGAVPRAPREPSWIAGGGEVVRPVPWAPPAPVAPRLALARAVDESEVEETRDPEAPDEPEIEPVVPPESRPVTFAPAARPVTMPPPPPPGPDPELLAARAAFAEAAVAMALARDEARQQAIDELAEVAVEIAAAILEDAIEARPELHRALARAAIEPLDPEAPVRLRASRESYEAIVERFGVARIELGGRRLEVVQDTTLEGLGVVAESGDVRVDGRLATRLAQVRRAMRGPRTQEAGSSPPRRADPEPLEPAS